MLELHPKIQEIIALIHTEQLPHIIVTVDHLLSIAYVKQQVMFAASQDNLRISWEKPTEISINNIVIRFKITNESIQGYDNYFLVEIGSL